MKAPCDDCPIRQWYAETLGQHFYGDDCLFECEVWDLYRYGKSDIFRIKEENHDPGDSAAHRSIEV